MKFISRTGKCNALSCMCKRSLSMRRLAFTAARSAATLSSVKNKNRREKKKKRQKGLEPLWRLPAKDAFKLQQYELYYLVLVDHVDRYVARLRFGPEERGSENDGHALGGHAVGFAVVDHPAREGGGDRSGFRLPTDSSFGGFISKNKITSTPTVSKRISEAQD